MEKLKQTKEVKTIIKEIDKRLRIFKQGKGKHWGKIGHLTSSEILEIIVELKSLRKFIIHNS